MEELKINRKRIWFSFDVYLQAGAEVHTIEISIMCFSLGIYWWNKDYFDEQAP